MEAANRGAFDPVIGHSNAIEASARKEAPGERQSARRERAMKSIRTWVLRTGSCGASWAVCCPAT